jgi:pyrimidine operon attenuation protein / uracil phosphoribosyltransferase
VGIQRRGVPLAKRLAKSWEEMGASPFLVGTLDITFYRDDMHEISEHPVVHDTDISFDINGKNVVLVDDVLFTGRTIRSALDQLMYFGRPHRVLLAVLVDRGHRELPIAPDIVGETMATAERDIVEVHLEELDGEDAVWVTSGKKSTARDVA